MRFELAALLALSFIFACLFLGSRSLHNYSPMQATFFGIKNLSKPISVRLEKSTFFPFLEEIFTSNGFRIVKKSFSTHVEGIWNTLSTSRNASVKNLES